MFFLFYNYRWRKSLIGDGVVDEVGDGIKDRIDDCVGESGGSINLSLCQLVLLSLNQFFGRVFTVPSVVLLFIQV